MNGKDSKETALQVYGDAVLVKSTSIWERVNDPIQAIEKVGKWLAASGMFGLRSPEQGYVVAITCMEEKITPLEFARRYHIIENRPAKRADRMQADFQARGGRITWIEYTNEVCEAVFLHPQFAPKGVTIRVTLKEMQQKGITKGKHGEKDNWKNWPRQMLKARVISEGVRQVDPAVCAGEYTPEEIADFDEHNGAIPAEAIPANQPTPKQESKGKKREAKKPESAPEPPKEEKTATHNERCQRVLRAFAGWTITQQDLEAKAGDFETGEVVSMGEWTEEHFARFQEAHDKIRKLGGEERAQAISEEFNIPMSELAE